MPNEPQVWTPDTGIPPPPDVSGPQVWTPETGIPPPPDAPQSAPAQQPGLGQQALDLGAGVLKASWNANPLTGLPTKITMGALDAAGVTGGGAAPQTAPVSQQPQRDPADQWIYAHAQAGTDPAVAFSNAFGRPFGPQDKAAYDRYAKVHQLAQSAVPGATSLGRIWGTEDDVAAETPPELRADVLRATRDLSAQQRPVAQQDPVTRLGEAAGQGISSLPNLAASYVNLDADQREFRKQLQQARAGADPLVDPNAGLAMKPYGELVKAAEMAGPMVTSGAAGKVLGTAGKALGMSEKVAGVFGSGVSAAGVFGPGAAEAGYQEAIDRGADDTTARWVGAANAAATSLLFAGIPGALGLGGHRSATTAKTINEALIRYAKAVGHGTGLMGVQGATDEAIQQIAEAVGGNSKGANEAAKAILTRGWDSIISSAGSMALMSVPQGMADIGDARANKQFQREVMDPQLDANLGGGPRPVDPVAQRFIDHLTAEQQAKEQANATVNQSSPGQADANSGAPGGQEVGQGEGGTPSPAPSGPRVPSSGSGPQGQVQQTPEQVIAQFRDRDDFRKAVEAGKGKAVSQEPWYEWVQQQRTAGQSWGDIYKNAWDTVVEQKRADQLGQRLAGMGKRIGAKVAQDQQTAMWEQRKAELPTGDEILRNPGAGPYAWRPVGASQAEIEKRPDLVEVQQTREGPYFRMKRPETAKQKEQSNADIGKEEIPVRGNEGTDGQTDSDSGPEGTGRPVPRPDGQPESGGTAAGDGSGGRVDNVPEVRGEDQSGRNGSSGGRAPDAEQADGTGAGQSGAGVAPAEELRTTGKTTHNGVTYEVIPSDHKDGDWLVRRTEKGVSITSGAVTPHKSIPGWSRDEAMKKALAEMGFDSRTPAVEPEKPTPAEDAAKRRLDDKAPQESTQDAIDAAMRDALAAELGLSYDGPDTAAKAPTGPKESKGAASPRKSIGRKTEVWKQKTKANLDAALQDFKDAFSDVITPIGPIQALDPRKIGAAVKLTKAALEHGVATFADFVSYVAQEVGPDVASKVAPYIESAWRGLRPSKEYAHLETEGKVSDIIPLEVKNGDTRDAAVGGVRDGGGEHGGNAPPVSGETSTRGDAGKGGRGEGGGVPQDAGETGGKDAAGLGGGNRPIGTPDAGKRQLGGRKASDAGGTKPSGQVLGDDRNHVIRPNDDLAVSSVKDSLRRNLDAIKLLKRLESENRNATPNEKRLLAQYSGWGGLSQAFDEYKGDAMSSERAWGRDEAWEKQFGQAYTTLRQELSEQEWETARDTVLNAHYTSKPVIQQMWKLVERLGFAGGRVLEPGSGIGHFPGLVPDGLRDASKFILVERDSLSSRILKKLYPEADVHGTAMEDFRVAPGTVDLVVGNVPFARQGPTDAKARYGKDLNLHNYFIARSLDALRPGGMAVLISTHHTLDSAQEQRALLAEKGDLVGAIRLPNNAFQENAKTAVTTDILVFRRPMDAGRDGEPFIATKEVDVQNSKGFTTKARVNQYFVDHPDMVLGEQAATGTQYRQDEYTVEPTPGNLADKIAGAVEKMPKGLYGGQQATGDVLEADQQTASREGYLDFQDGKLMISANGKVQSVADGHIEGYPKQLFTQKGIERARGYISLRDGYKQLRDVMLNPESTDADVAESQKRLERLYDLYTKMEGHLSGHNSRIFKMDPDYYRVRSLEDRKTWYDPETGKEVVYHTKADVFSKRTLAPRRAPDHAATVPDGVWVSLGYKGKVDPEYIASLMGRDAKDVEKELVESGLAYRNPGTQQFELPAAYLSGNVKKKLREAEVAIGDDPAYQRNVDALRAVQPEPVGIVKVPFELGHHWIPSDIIEDFASDLFRSGARVTYNPTTDTWQVRADKNSIGVSQDWGTDRVDGADILEDTLNLRTTKVFDRVETGEYDDRGRPKTTRRLNEKATQATKAIAARMQDRFKKYVNANGEAAAKMEAVYNDKYNAYVDPTYDGSHLELPGSSNEIKLRFYQKNAIWRILQDGSAMLAHAVGAGKTYTMIGAAMEMRRTGLAKRPILVVQNATLGQFATSFLKMYPDANVLVARKEDLQSENRQLFLSRVTSSDWDAVVMAQSSFDRLASTPEVEQSYIHEKLTELQDAIQEEGGEKAKTPSVKDLVRARNALVKRLEKILETEEENRGSNRLFFDDLHADALFLDEAHAYKKPFFMTKLENLVGLNKQASARGISTMLKIRGIQDKTGGRNIVLATGTPITNTLGEAWHMVNFVNPKLNREFSVPTFDGFVSTFAKRETTRDMDAGGNWVFKDALTKFINGPELMHYLRNSWDMLSPEQLAAHMEGANTAIPKLRGGDRQAVTVDVTPGVEKFSDFLRRVYERFKALPPKERREMSYIPAIAYGAAKAAALDIRLVSPGSRAETGSKVERCVELAMQDYRRSMDSKGVQLIFSDIYNPRNMSALTSFMNGERIQADIQGDTGVSDKSEADAEAKGFLYHDIKQRLMAEGVPESEIAIVGEANTDDKREKLFDRANAGDVRFLIGSSSRMGVGVNVQRKVVALHHLDAPWLPADVEQREGRAIRFGNENSEVAVYRYAMKKTLDAAIFAKTLRKAKFIWQVLAGKLEGREFEDPASALTMSVEEQLAAIDGNPLLFEKMDLDRQRRDLMMEQESHSDAVARAREAIRNEKSNLDHRVKTTIPQCQTRLQQLEAIGKGAPLEIGERTYTDEKEAEEAFDKFRVAHSEDITAKVKSGELGEWLPYASNALLSPYHKYVSGWFKIGGLVARVSAGYSKGGAGYKPTARTIVTLSLPEDRGVNLYEGDAKTLQGLLTAVRKLPDVQREYIKQAEANNERARQEIAQLEEVAAKKWGDQDALDKLTERLAEIETQLVQQGVSTPAPAPPDDPGFDDGPASPPSRRSPGGSGGNAAMAFEEQPGSIADNARKYAARRLDDRGNNPPPPPADTTTAAPEPPEPPKKIMASHLLAAKKALEMPDLPVFQAERNFENAKKERSMDQAEAETGQAEVAMWKLPQVERDQFIDRWEKGEAQATPELDRVAKAWMDRWTAWADAINEIRPDKLTEDERAPFYFSRGYEGSSSKEGQSWLQKTLPELFAGRPNAGYREGGKPSMMMERTLDSMKAGRELRKSLMEKAEKARREGRDEEAKELDRQAGWLKPISDNPLEMQRIRYDGATDYLRDLRLYDFADKRGWIKTQSSLQSEPGWHVPIVNGMPSSMFTIFGPPTMTMKEAYDAVQFDQIHEFGRSMGVNMSRVLNLGGKKWGVAYGDKEVVTKRNGQLAVLFHEIGHIIGTRYGLLDWMNGDPKDTNPQDVAERVQIKKEMRDLADARFKGQETTDAYKKYVRKGAEKEAVMLEALLHAPGEFQKVAPHVYKAFVRFLSENPKLKPLLDIQPSLVLGSSEYEVPIHGMRIMGYRALPNELARAVERYGSEGLRAKLQRGGVAGNVLSLGLGGLRFVQQKMLQSSLTLSAFHLTNVARKKFETYLGSMIEHGLQPWSKGSFGQAGKAAGLALASPLTIGRDILSATTGLVGSPAEQWRADRLKPDSELTPERRKQITESEKGGALLSASMTGDWQKAKVHWAKMKAPDLNAIQKGTEAAKAFFHAVMSAPEFTTKPVMRAAGDIKVGVALDLQAEWEATHQGASEDQRSVAYRKIRGDVDARFGQVNWENINMNRVSKDLAQLVFFAPGWKGGNLGALYMAARDAVKGEPGSGRHLLTGSIVHLPAVLAGTALFNTVYQYLKTGKFPWDDETELQDFFEPRTGDMNPDGTASRVASPGMERDWYALLTHPIALAQHSLNPALAAIADIYKGTDYFGTQITTPVAGEGKLQAAGRKTLDYGKHIGSKFVPLSIRNMQQLSEEGAGWKGQTQAFFGITPVPAAHTRSEASQYLLDEFGKVPRPPRTKADVERATKVIQAVKAARDSGAKRLDSKALGEYANSRQIHAAQKKLDLAPGFPTFFARSNLRQAIEAYNLATDKEKNQVAGALRKKWDSKMKTAFNDRTPEGKREYEELKALYDPIRTDVNSRGSRKLGK